MTKNVTVKKQKKVTIGKYIDPKTDFGFKHIFGTKEFLMSFLNTVVKIDGGISDLQYGNTEKKGISKEDRATFYDLYCTTGKGEHIIIELQFRHQQYYRSRALYYAARLILLQGEDKSGTDWDFRLAPVYSVNITNFHLTGSKKELPDGKKYSVYTLFDEEPLLTFVFLELPRFHFPKNINEIDDDLEQWVYVIKNMSKLKTMPEFFKNTVFEKIFLKAEVAQMSTKDRNQYERSLKRYLDMNALLKEVAESRKEVAESRKEVAESRRIIVNYQQVVKAKDNEIATKDNEIATKEREIAELRRRLGLNQ